LIVIQKMKEKLRSTRGRCARKCYYPARWVQKKKGMGEKKKDQNETKVSVEVGKRTARRRKYKKNDGNDVINAPFSRAGAEKKRTGQEREGAQDRMRRKPTRCKKKEGTEKWARGPRERRQKSWEEEETTERGKN